LFFVEGGFVRPEREDFVLRRRGAPQVVGRLHRGALVAPMRVRLDHVVHESLMPRELDSDRHAQSLALLTTPAMVCSARPMNSWGV
jgi:hypothetical protein